MSDWLDYIDERWKELMESELRPGFYAAAVSNALQSLRRVAIDAEWGPTLEQARRISSPILDVIPSVETRVAVISQDGVPEFPAVLGKLWDDAAPADEMTVWLRANLQEHAGHVELGAENGLRIKVGVNDGSIEETNDGVIALDGDEAHILGDTHKLSRGDRVSSELADIKSSLNAVISYVNGKIDEAGENTATFGPSEADQKATKYREFSSTSGVTDANNVYGD